MIIPDYIRKCVGYIAVGRDVEIDPKFDLKGTVFFVSTGDGGNQSHYLVTAKHVVEKIKSTYGVDTIYIRINCNKNSCQWLALAISEFKFHDDINVDVAVSKFDFDPNWDHLNVPESLFIDSSNISNFEIGIGDELFVTGLFVNHHGQFRNLPIVRIGNIVAMPEEPIKSTFGDVEAYLVECRSIGGLSGSPVFHVDPTNYRGPMRAMFETHRVKYPVKLLGLIHGHWDQMSTQVDGIDSTGVEKNNVGIAIVIPAEKITEVIRRHF